MDDRALETIGRYRMFEQGDCVLVGFSGGADSVALLAFLWQHAPQLGLTVRAVHLDHCLRGAESDRDAAFVQAFCAERKIGLVLRHEDVHAAAAEKGLSIEEAARACRYRLFEQLACEWEQTGVHVKVATAHTLTDSEETTLINMARGTGLRGVCGIAPVRGRYVRPLIRCTRAQTEAYCRAHTLSYVTDSSNLEDIYGRNRIRHHAMPALASVCRAYEENYRRMVEHLEEEERYLTEQADAALAACGCDGGIDAVRLCEWPRAIRLRAVARLLAREGLPYDACKLDALCDALGRERFEIQLCPDRYAGVKAGVLYLRTTEPPCPPFRHILRPGKLDIGGREYTISVLEHDLFEKMVKNPRQGLKNALSYDKLEGVAVVRQRQAGDRIRLSASAGTQKLKKLFNSSHIPLPERDRIPVIADERSVVWVEGYGCDLRVAVDADTKRVLIINRTKEPSQV